MSELAAGSETLPELKARHAKEVGDVKFQGRQRVKVIDEMLCRRSSSNPAFSFYHMTLESINVSDSPRNGFLYAFTSD